MVMVHNASHSHLSTDIMPTNLRWLEDIRPDGPSGLSEGVSFGMAWPSGTYWPGQTFVFESEGRQYPLDSREIAFWADGSLKWTAHSVSGHFDSGGPYTVKGAPWPEEPSHGIRVERQGAALSLESRRGLRATFAAPGSSSLLRNLTINDQAVCSGATIVASIDGTECLTRVDSVDVENATVSRVVVKVSGVMETAGLGARLPFDVRFYVYSDAPSVKIIHSFIHDLDPDTPLTSLGLRFSCPLGRTEPYNRHVRLGGFGGGILKENVQGLTGLRHGPTFQNRLDQASGRAVTLREDEEAKTGLAHGLRFVPQWDDYSLAQLSADGFNIKKRTQPGCSWVKVTGGTRADGTAYVGSARQGGFAVGMYDFWERFPTQLDLSDLTTDEGAVTVWMYSPLAEPLEMAPYHGGLGLDSYAKQLEALNITYEDYEPGFASANGIARTNEFILKPCSSTPSNQELGAFSRLVRSPPRLIATPAHLHTAGVFHGYWAPDFRILGTSPTCKEAEIEGNLDLLFNYYSGQVEQHRWYGFWDHGDVQHTYDTYRHAWRYDVGGYAWDNSELSTDLWLWLYFLHTGRADVFKMAEDMTRHTSEVDVYHAGRFKGFGTRHGVQHFSDSSKQLRISNVLYRRIYFYLTGDERTGDLISEQQNCQHAITGLNSHRKVQEPVEIPTGFAMVNIGLDCGALIAAWLTAWERRTAGWEHCMDLLFRLLDGIAGLSHGIGNNALLLNPSTGEVCACPPPIPESSVSHLSTLFGFPEIFAELLNYARYEYVPTFQKFLKVWLSYCRAYNGGPDVQLEEFGFTFPPHATWRQSHSTLTAFAATQQSDDNLARAAWIQFFNTDGYSQNQDWTVRKSSPPEYFAEGEEAAWINTNEAARYGVSAISNLANIGRYLE